MWLVWPRSLSSREWLSWTAGVERCPCPQGEGACVCDMQPGAHTSLAKAPGPASAQKMWWVDSLRPGVPQGGGQGPHLPGTGADLTGALSAGTSSIEIPVLCLLVNGDPSTLEVGQGRGGLAAAPNLTIAACRALPGLGRGTSGTWACGLRRAPKLMWGPLSPPCRLRGFPGPWITLPRG